MISDRIGYQSPRASPSTTDDSPIRQRDCEIGKVQYKVRGRVGTRTSGVHAHVHVGGITLGHIGQKGRDIALRGSRRE